MSMIRTSALSPVADCEQMAVWIEPNDFGWRLDRYSLDRSVRVKIEQLNRSVRRHQREPTVVRAEVEFDASRFQHHLLGGDIPNLGDLTPGALVLGGEQSTVAAELADIGAVACSRQPRKFHMVDSAAKMEIAVLIASHISLERTVIRQDKRAWRQAVSRLGQSQIGQNQAGDGFVAQQQFLLFLPVERWSEIRRPR